MQADRKRIAIFLIILGFIMLGLIIYFGFIRKTATPVTVIFEPPLIVGQLPTGPEIGTTTPSDKPRNNLQYDINTVAPHVTTADDLGKVSMSFAERFGSYSNQSNYANFTDLKILMTDNMKTWADKYVTELKSQAQAAGVYSGVISTALTYEVKSFDDKKGTAEILITLQRRESAEEIAGGKPYVQSLTLSLVKENSDWLFDKAYWEKKK